MDSKEIEIRLTKLKGPIKFWFVWGTMWLLMAIGILWSDRHSNNTEVSAWFFSILLMGIAGFGYWKVAYHSKTSFKLTIGENVTTLEEIFWYNTNIKEFKNAEVEEIHLIRCGVDGDGITDKFPRYGIVVKIGLPYLLFGDALKKDVLLAAEALSSSYGIPLTDQGENFFKYERSWKIT